MREITILFGSYPQLFQRRFEGAWREPLQAARQEDWPGQGDGDAQGRRGGRSCPLMGVRLVFGNFASAGA